MFLAQTYLNQSGIARHWYPPQLRALRKDLPSASRKIQECLDFAEQGFCTDLRRLSIGKVVGEFGLLAQDRSKIRSGRIALPGRQLSEIFRERQRCPLIASSRLPAFDKESC